jgi:carbon-monoxide dehydrogenase small subunit
MSGAAMIEPITKRDIAFRINGRDVTRNVDVRVHAADFLRDDLALTSIHLGCEHGVCGACTIRIDGEIVRGCLVLATQLDGSNVETVEGLTADGTLTKLQEAFVRHNALQCGFCTPGMLLCAAELLETHSHPSRDEVRTAISGNYCRCTGYQAIVNAIIDVSSTEPAS